MKEPTLFQSKRLESCDNTEVTPHFERLCFEHHIELTPDFSVLQVLLVIFLIVLGINGLEFVVLIVIAFVVIGPERMPEYAQKLKEGVKWVRQMAFSAREDLKETMGDNPLGDFDWKQYDPRQYDPRTIVREALAEDDAERAAQAEKDLELNKPVEQNLRRLPRGAYAPFDVEAT